jgi:hypothetical protein
MIDFPQNISENLSKCISGCGSDEEVIQKLKEKPNNLVELFMVALNDQDWLCANEARFGKYVATIDMLSETEVLNPELTRRIIDAGKYILKDYSGNGLRELEQLCKDDMTVISPRFNGELKINHFFLKEKGGFFKNLLRGSYKEVHEGKIAINVDDKETFERLMEFLETDEIKEMSGLNKNDFLKLLKTAGLYDMEQLSAYIAQDIGRILDQDNVLEFLHYSTQNESLKDVADLCYRWMNRNIPGIAIHSNKLSDVTIDYKNKDDDENEGFDSLKPIFDLLNNKKINVFLSIKAGKLSQGKIIDLINELTGLYGLKIISRVIKQLPSLPDSLQELNCRDCEELENLPKLPDTLQELNCSRSRMNQLPQLPITLKVLNCSSFHNLEQLPKLPDTLQELNCSNSLIEELPQLPESLQKLNCSGCYKLASLPELPEAFQELNCSGSVVEKLPELPEALRKLNCSSCYKLASLPELPEGFQELNCSDSIVEELPQLPIALQKLNCSGCYRLESLPELPEGFQELNCSGSVIRGLPLLPSTLEVLDCGNCEIMQHLPKLPAFLGEFKCGGSSVQELPDLPKNLKVLDCSNCEFLTSLPKLPDSLEKFNCSGSVVEELPDLPKNLKVLNCSNCEFLKSLPELPDTLQGKW